MTDDIDDTCVGTFLSTVVPSPEFTIDVVTPRPQCPAARDRHRMGAARRDGHDVHEPADNDRRLPSCQESTSWPSALLPKAHTVPSDLATSV